MTRRYILLYCLLGFMSELLAQAVTTLPAFPTADAEITLVFDVKQAKDTRAQGLLGKTSDVFLWSGAGSTATGDAFQFQPAGQTNFSAPFEPGRMTSLGNDRWQIKLVPRTYFGVPANTPIRRLGVLLKSGDGRAQTEDFFVTIYDAGLNITRLAPAQKNLFVEPNATLPVRYRVSQRATLSLTVDGQAVNPTTESDTIRADLPTGSEPGVRKTVILRATTSSLPIQSVADTFFFTVRPQPTIAPLPNGVRDGVNYVGGTRNDATTTLVLYAPKKNFVYAIGEFNNWTPGPQYLMNRTPDGDRYWLTLTGLQPGREVAYQYWVDGSLAVADPYAEKILDPNNDKFIPATTYPNLKPYPAGATGIVSVFQPNQSSYVWQSNVLPARPTTGEIVYELLVRDFSAARTYQAVIDSLPYLKRLGVTTIELMPIMEFAGNDSWGYNPIFFFAPDKAYGTKNDLKRFIDVCHQNNIKVVLDMVLNQADFEFPYVKLYWDGTKPTADSPFFNPQATHPFSVFFDFNHESPATQAFVERVNRYWLTEYRFDGFRFDLSKGFTQKNTGGDVSAWSAYDASRIAIWKRIYGQLTAVNPNGLYILEHFAENREEQELAELGFLMWGNENGGFRNSIKGFTANIGGISYKQRGWSKPNLLGYAESHDEERLVYDAVTNGRTEGSYNVKSLPTALERAKLAAAFLLAVPGPRLIWQFGELGYDISINQNGRTGAKPIKWDYYQDANRLKLFNVYKNLIELKKTVPAFSTANFTADMSGIVKQLTLTDASNTIYLIGNFDAVAQLVEAAFPTPGTWYDYFTGQPVTVANPKARIVLQPGEFHLFSSQKLPIPEANLVPWTAAITLVTANEPHAAGQLIVSPNPADSELHIDLRSAYRGAVLFSLRDGNGRSIRSLRVQKNTDQLRHTLDVAELATGLYILHVQQGNQQTTAKVLKR
ncbi:alpha-amylase family glycosyl hydrolase [Spirosoma montaniterrae]|uniref:Alpha-amylase n=1 Tax=Spirosoma montaniterrae TaxID=1178516 RepID=A0A1P9WWX2_9BACT|nr:alpha-amylase family glycosyl hydrolase [Spirosoma montaniterrae]AQG79871.1 alpha-amylase [Spirosoma montaniterrae]